VPDARGPAAGYSGNAGGQQQQRQWQGQGQGQGPSGDGQGQGGAPFNPHRSTEGPSTWRKGDAIGPESMLSKRREQREANAARVNLWAESDSEDEREAIRRAEKRKLAATARGSRSPSPSRAAADDSSDDDDGRMLPGFDLDALKAEREAEKAAAKSASKGAGKSGSDSESGSDSASESSDDDKKKKRSKRSRSSSRKHKKRRRSRSASSSSGSESDSDSDSSDDDRRRKHRKKSKRSKKSKKKKKSSKHRSSSSKKSKRSDSDSEEKSGDSGSGSDGDEKRDRKHSKRTKRSDSAESASASAAAAAAAAAPAPVPAAAAAAAAPSDAAPLSDVDEGDMWEGAGRATGGAGGAGDSDSGEEFVGPRPPTLDKPPDLRSYGGALMPGEGEAIAGYVQAGKRIPRRGEVGLTSVQIEDFEKLGYVMSGSRHKRMNAIRIRKENQVYSAEEKRALSLLNFDEKNMREKRLMNEFRKFVGDKLGDAGGEEQPPANQ